MDKEELKFINHLIVRVGKGDESALVSLYQELGGRMLSIAMGITKDKGLAEDAVQESFIKIVRYAASFKNIDNGYGWICTVVRNESLTILKRYGRSCADIDEFFDIADLKQDSSVTYKQVEVKLAMEKLTKGERKLVWLKYMCDMTVREIAKEVCQPKSTVMYNLQRAEEKLRALLE